LRHILILLIRVLGKAIFNGKKTFHNKDLTVDYLFSYLLICLFRL